MKIEKIPVAFKANEYADAPNFFTVEFSEECIESIKKAQKILRENKDFSTIKISTVFDMFNEEDSEDVSEWRDDVNEFIVYEHEVFLYAQNKYDSGDQIESYGLCEYSEEFQNLLK